MSGFAVVRMADSQMEKKKPERKKKGRKPQNKCNRKLFFRSITVSVGSENG